jgi:hypothetical protein
MKQAELGSTGLRVTPLVFGSLPLGPLQADLDPREGGRLIRHALDCGINMVDTAELYGTYAHIREGLAGLSNLPVLASKTHATSAEDARLHVENALRGIGVERLDIVHIHGARLSDPFNQRAEVLQELLRMRDEGLIGHVGLSTHYICAVRAAADHPEIEVIHPLINRGGMGILDGSAEEMAAAISYAAARGKGISSPALVKAWVTSAALTACMQSPSACSPVKRSRPISPCLTSGPKMQLSGRHWKAEVATSRSWRISAKAAVPAWMPAPMTHCGLLTARPRSSKKIASSAAIVPPPAPNLLFEWFKFF